MFSFIVFDRYKSYSPYDMQESIRKEVKGELEKSFLTLGETFLPVLMYMLLKQEVGMGYGEVLVCFFIASY